MVRLAIRGEVSPCALRGRLGEKPMWLRASESLGLDSYCGWGERGSVVSELDEDEDEWAARMLA